MTVEIKIKLLFSLLSGNQDTSHEPADKGLKSSFSAKNFVFCGGSIPKVQDGISHIRSPMLVMEQP